MSAKDWKCTRFYKRDGYAPKSGWAWGTISFVDAHSLWAILQRMHPSKDNPKRGQRGYYYSPAAQGMTMRGPFKTLKACVAAAEKAARERKG